MLAGEAEQASARGRQADSVYVVLQDAVLHVGQGPVAQRLLQKKADEWSLEALEAELPQGLEDPSDPQVVVVGSDRQRDNTVRY